MLHFWLQGPETSSKFNEGDDDYKKTAGGRNRTLLWKCSKKPKLVLKQQAVLEAISILNKDVYRYRWMEGTEAKQAISWIWRQTCTLSYRAPNALKRPGTEISKEPVTK